MQLERASGILVHPTSFPGPHGVGDLGAGAYEFVDWLAIAGQQYWQLMPLSPVGYGDSPYASLSAFGGNPLLISIDGLSLLGLDAGGDSRGFNEYEVDYSAAGTFKNSALRRAYESFKQDGTPQLRAQLSEFEAIQASWLHDFAFYMSLKERFRGVSWQDWPEDVRLREPKTLAQLENELSDGIGLQSFVQFLFWIQWTALKQHANEQGIRIIGDIPIYVALDSADVWSNPSQFRLLPDRSPEVVSGVPPDLFTDDGQLWGNPVFDWSYMEQDGFSWWVDRVRRLTELVDVIRIDHFRGLAAGWVIPAGEETARDGRWERGPGASLFHALEHELGVLPIVVEDLGIITPDVVDLRLKLGLQGMKVLQFGFDGDPDNPYLPHNFVRDCVVYTGTHDNQTTIGWFQSCSEAQRQQVQTYLGADGTDIAWDFIRLAFESVADLAIVPLQDVMRLGDEARMNRPGIAFGNWNWRYLSHQLHDGLARGLRELSGAYGRLQRPKLEHGYDPFDYSAPDTAHLLYDRRDAIKVG